MMLNEITRAQKHACGAPRTVRRYSRNGSPCAFNTRHLVRKLTSVAPWFRYTVSLRYATEEALIGATGHGTQPAAARCGRRGCRIVRNPPDCLQSAAPGSALICVQWFCFRNFARQLGRMADGALPEPWYTPPVLLRRRCARADGFELPHVCSS